jgi:acetyl esterase/lipase
MSETIDAGVEAPRDAGSIALTRVNECEIPAYIANDAGGPSVLEDIAYGDDKKQKYDLVLPDTSPKALVVIVHGGGWTSGGKSLYRPTIRMLGTIGYAAASVSYRLAGDETRAFPVGLADVRCAIRSAQARAGVVSKTVVLGASAGGHLAAMVATEPDAPVYDGDCADRRPVRIAGAILYYAPLELDRSRERYVPIMRQAVDEFLYGAQTWAEAGVDGSADLFERDRTDWSIRAIEATPSHHTLRGAPPMLILQGAIDTIVPPADAHDFANALERAGVSHLLVELPGQGHGFPVLGHKPEVKPASCSTLHFLEQIAGL